MAAAAAHAEVQNLLRFLTQDAKVPLSDALPRIGALRKAGLKNADAIATAGADMLKGIFANDKIAKQVANAARRVISPKKRTASEAPLQPSPKRAKSSIETEDEREDRLELLMSDLTAEELLGIEVETNRAPLVLAFGVIVLKHTMPEQPVSSRLSLAQALASANSQSKAKSIGLLAEATADEAGWAKGQPKVTVLGREIAVLRRHIPTGIETDGKNEDEDSQNTMSASFSSDTFWGLDLEAMRKHNGPLAAGKQAGSTRLPIYTPEAARAYLSKAMSISAWPAESTAVEAKKKPTAADVAAKKAKALSVVLRAIDLLCDSWSATLSKEELDRRAWSWYVRVRPDIAQGQAGWGQKGTVRLSDILNLRRSEI